MRCDPDDEAAGGVFDPVTYHLCDVVSGVVLGTLPLEGEISKTRGEPETASWDLALNDPRVSCPTYTENAEGRSYQRNDHWATLLQPWKVMVAAEWRGTLIQAWVLVQVTYGGVGTVPLGGATLERLLQGVLCGDHEWWNVDLSYAAAQVVEETLVPRGGWTVQWSECGTTGDVYHLREGNTTVFSALDEIQGTEGGPAWMTDVDWAPGEEGRRVQKIVRIGRPLGQPKTHVVFRARPGEYTRMLDWTTDNAALEVWASTDGTGLGYTNQSWRSPRLDEGWHPNELWLTFSDVDSDQALRARRDKRGRELEDGTNSWEATLRINEQPLVKHEWTIGDTVTLRAEPGPTDPFGGEIVGEVEGWALNVAEQTIVPRLYTEEAGGAENV